MPASGVGAVVVNVTVADPVGAGFVTVYPTGAPRPNASSLNYVAGQVVPNLVVAKIGNGGRISLYALTGTHLIVDVNAWFPADTGTTSLSPARLLDTRPTGQTVDGVEQSGGRVPADGVLDLPVLGRGGVPASGVGAVVVNVTVADPVGAGFVTVYPTGAPRPNASSLNYVAGQVVPNLVVAKIGNGGRISLYALTGTHLIVDVNAWFPADTGTTSLSPARLLDTRPTGQTVDGVEQSGGRVPADGVLDLPVLGRGGVPASGVGAVVVNVTVADPVGAGFVTVYPTGAPRPNASSLNYVAGQVVPNLVVAKIGNGGRISLYALTGTHLIVDVTAWFPPEGGLRVVAPSAGFPAATQGVDYSTTLEGAGGLPPYRWAINALPSGFQLDENSGLVTGRADTTSTSTVEVVLTDAGGRSVSRTANFEVSEGTTDPMLQGQGSGYYPAFGTVLVHGSEYFSGAGVDVISNGLVGCYDGCRQHTASGIAYQCVELVNRFVTTQQWSGPISGNANQIYGTAPAGAYEKHPSGDGYLPVAGDIIVWAGGRGGNGHVAIVEWRDNGRAGFVEQNASANGRAVLPISNTGVLSAYGSLTNIGYLHARRNGTTTSPAPNLDSSSKYQAFEGDFNGDQKVDVGLRNQQTGTFFARYGPSYGPQDTFTWDNSITYQTFMGDFNGDKVVDVGLRNRQSGTFYVRYGPNYTTQDTYTWDNSTDYQAFMGDFNGDGVVDVGLRNQQTGTFYARFGPSFSTQTTYTWDNSIVFQSFMGDFNGDKIVDVGLRNPQSGTFYVRYGPNYTAQDTYTWDNSTDYQAFMGDFNGDGVVDVGLRNQQTGTFYSRFGSDFTTQESFEWDHN